MSVVPMYHACDSITVAANMVADPNSSPLMHHCLINSLPTLHCLYCQQISSSSSCKGEQAVSLVHVSVAWNVWGGGPFHAMAAESLAHESL